MFFAVYSDLCKSRNLTPNGAAKEMGFASSSVTQWKNGSTPRPAALQKIADFFGVSMSYLLGDEIEKGQKEKPALPWEGELTEGKIRAIEKIKNMPPEELARKMPALEAILDM